MMAPEKIFLVLLLLLVLGAAPAVAHGERATEAAAHATMPEFYTTDDGDAVLFRPSDPGLLDRSGVTMFLQAESSAMKRKKFVDPVTLNLAFFIATFTVKLVVRTIFESIDKHYQHKEILKTLADLTCQNSILAYTMLTRLDPLFSMIQSLLNAGNSGTGGEEQGKLEALQAQVSQKMHEVNATLNDPKTCPDQAVVRAIQYRATPLLADTCLAKPPGLMRRPKARFVDAVKALVDQYDNENPSSEDGSVAPPNSPIGSPLGHRRGRSSPHVTFRSGTPPPFSFSDEDIESEPSVGRLPVFNAEDGDDEFSGKDDELFFEMIQLGSTSLKTGGLGSFLPTGASDPMVPQGPNYFAWYLCDLVMDLSLKGIEKFVKWKYEKSEAEARAVMCNSMKSRYHSGMFARLVTNLLKYFVVTSELRGELDGKIKVPPAVIAKMCEDIKKCPQSPWDEMSEAFPASSASKKYSTAKKLTTLVLPYMEERHQSSLLRKTILWMTRTFGKGDEFETPACVRSHCNAIEDCDEAYACRMICGLANMVFNHGDLNLEALALDSYRSMLTFMIGQVTRSLPLSSETDQLVKECPGQLSVQQLSFEEKVLQYGPYADSMLSTDHCLLENFYLVQLLVRYAQCHPTQELKPSVCRGLFISRGKLQHLSRSFFFTDNEKAAEEENQRLIGLCKSLVTTLTLPRYWPNYDWRSEEAGIPLIEELSPDIQESMQPVVAWLSALQQVKASKFKNVMSKKGAFYGELMPKLALDRVPLFLRTFTKTHMALMHEKPNVFQFLVRKELYMFLVDNTRPEQEQAAELMRALGLTRLYKSGVLSFLTALKLVANQHKCCYKTSESCTTLCASGVGAPEPLHVDSGPELAIMHLIHNAYSDANSLVDLTIPYQEDYLKLERTDTDEKKRQSHMLDALPDTLERLNLHCPIWALRRYLSRDAYPQMRQTLPWIGTMFRLKDGHNCPAFYDSDAAAARSYIENGGDTV
eukprot:gnl/Hemi2/21208_TR7028_c0_g1_i1.p1 gnl/Hemi2/21208_TR7028_c0_g1~~gnl/Hemi2/21208_TR7028_c0_g1_i1.p1  ORF type:complete len:982 (-),score=251.75 gnl/Hemi2/21208_TR7028_c0_g1_i1:513-3458(-)